MIQYLKYTTGAIPLSIYLLVDPIARRVKDRVDIVLDVVAPRVVGPVHDGIQAQVIPHLALQGQVWDNVAIDTIIYWPDHVWTPEVKQYVDTIFDPSGDGVDY